MKVAKIVGIVATVIITILIAVGLWLFWESSPTQMLSSANSIKVPSTWQLKSETIVPIKNFCLEKSGCPAIDREWKIDRIYTKGELEGIFDRANISMRIQESACEPSDMSHGMGVTLPVCSGSAIKNKIRYKIYQNTNEARNEFGISLYVRKEPDYAAQ